MILIEKKYLKHFDYYSFILTVILSFIGLFFIYSATYTSEKPISLFFKKQFFGILSGIVIYFLFCYFDYRTVQKYGYFAYYAVITVLIFTIIKGNIGLGAKRWFSIGFLKFQPSELIKLFFPLFFCYYFMFEKENDIPSFSTFFPIIIVLFFSVLLILKQPDLGTGLVILFSGSILLWLAGLNKKYFIWAIIICSIGAPLLWKNLKPYQKKRIEVFLGAGESKKERYQIEQSQIAIGSGGLIGKGSLKGTQNKLLFLPETRTDFIFAVICEEWGFVGAITILVLYLLLFFRCFYVISTIKNFFAQLLATGLLIPIILTTIINISMVIGLLPIVGIPLPFISYGVSHLWISFASLGCYNNIVMRRFYFSL